MHEIWGTAISQKRLWDKYLWTSKHWHVTAGQEKKCEYYVKIARSGQDITDNSPPEFHPRQV